MNESDRRIRKTKKALREALASLLTEKELSSITVSELAEKADIHRGTFYAHYQDVYDLFDQIEKSVIKELAELIESDGEYTVTGLYTALVNYVYENARLYRAFFGSKGFYKHIGSWLEAAYIRSWENEMPSLQKNENISFLAAYHIQGLIAIIGRWVETDFVLPKADVIKLIHDIDYNIDSLFVG